MSSDTPVSHLDYAHGILASLAWVVFFPIGAILLRVLKTNNSWLVHAAIQSLTLLVFTAAVATGIILAQDTQQLSTYHAIIGLVLFAVVFLQAVGGILHHLLYRKYARRTIVSYVHIWLGRILITLGMINGGLGLLLAGNASKSDIIAYSVIAGVIWIVYVAVAALYSKKRDQPAEAGKEVKLDSRNESS